MLWSYYLFRYISRLGMIKVDGKIIDIVYRNEMFIVYVVFSKDGRLYLDEVSEKYNTDRFYLGQRVLLNIHSNGVFIEEAFI